ncbi:helix-turn-helix domain-containing protein [Aurantiacibacter suaedae]|uniref:helix-turn-helix domain-containing protein n=1 Tax=Aurantiacibacter suaedae TaxID=2545755 RepID=UPI0010F81F28|nr:helix-turn-helix domain-containing protein [Aurantiacibacter suaedae]
MLSIISTRDHEPRERLDFWNELIGSTYDGMSIDGVDGPFNASLGVWQSDAFRIVRPRSRPAMIVRHECGRTSSTKRTFLMHMTTQGQIEMEQRGRKSMLGPGDLVICAAEEYYRFNAATNHEMMVVEFDGATALDRLPTFEEHVARPIRAGLPGTRIIRRYMDSLWQEGREDLPPGQSTVHANILLDMTIACLSEPAGTLRPAADRTLAQLEDAIGARLDDYTLRPSSLAADLGIPLRTLQDVAARAGTTLNTMILRQRLQRATQLLRKHSGASIADVADACGFSDPSYFARRFAQHFGISPSEYRSCN